MIDSVRLRRLLLIAAVLFLVASGVALVAGSVPLAGGLLLGFILGAAPFASWAWIAARGLRSTRARALAVALLAAKLALYAGALYLFVTKNLVNPIGVMAGVTGVVALVSIGALLAPAPAKGAA
jgi:hypothetical protein